MFAIFATILFFASAPVRAEPSGKLNIVVSFSILADMVEQVGGERVQVYSLVPPGSDAHMFDPTPKDVQRIKQAGLVIVNGIGFEGWMARLIESSGFTGRVIEASAGIRPMAAQEAGHDHAGGDPHAWQDPMLAVRYVTNIANALMQADPAHETLFKTRADAYIRQLEALNREIAQAFAVIPQERRKVITSHDAFGYYAHAYNIVFLAPQGMNTDSEPSAGELAHLIDQIRKEKISALFVETISNKRLVQQLEADSGARLGGALYSDALSDKTGPASTYIAMMRHNTRLLAGAMMPTIDRK